MFAYKKIGFDTAENGPLKVCQKLEKNRKNIAPEKKKNIGLGPFKDSSRPAPAPVPAKVPVETVVGPPTGAEPLSGIEVVGLDPEADADLEATPAMLDQSSGVASAGVAVQSGTAVDGYVFLTPSLNGFVLIPNFLKTFFSNFSKIIF